MPGPWFVPGPAKCSHPEGSAGDAPGAARMLHEQEPMHWVSAAIPKPTGGRFLQLWQQEFLTLVLAAGGAVMVMFLLWEGIEQGFADSAEARNLMHYARGISTSLITAIVVGWLVRVGHLRQARALQAEIASRTHDAESVKASFEAVVEHTPAGLLIIDSDFRVMYANSEARRLHGTDDIVGKACYAAVAGSSEHCLGCPAGDVLQGGKKASWDGARMDSTLR